MASIKDGVKLGCGLYLFRALAGFFGLVVFLVFFGWLLSSSKESRRSRAAAGSQSAPAQSRPPTSHRTRTVHFRDDCIVRLEPRTDSPAVETLGAGIDVPVVERRGRWISVIVPSGQRGWGRCTPARR